MSDKKLGILAVLLVAVAVYFFFRPKSEVKSNTDIEVEDESVENVARTPAPAKSITTVNPGSASSVVAPKPILQNNADTSELADISDETKQRFASHMQTMARCLGTKAGPPAAQPEPTIEKLMDQLRPELGESVMQMHDWSQTEIIDSDGVRRRVRVDYDYVEGDEPKRRLSMYQMNSYNMPEIVELTPDQADNPNAEYVNSLIEGKKIIGDENANRVYFGHGEELLFSTRDGYLNNISVSRGARTFNCQNLDDGNSTCTCEQ